MYFKLWPYPIEVEQDDGSFKLHRWGFAWKFFTSEGMIARNYV